MPIKAFAFLALGAPLLLVAAPALAAGDKDKSADKPAADKKDGDKKDGDKPAADKKDGDPASAGEGSEKYDPTEDPMKTYRFVGLRFRDAVAPKFIMNWFAEGGRN